jgi:hypothetical protein
LWRLLLPWLQGLLPLLLLRLLQPRPLLVPPLLTRQRQKCFVASSLSVRIAVRFALCLWR